jgi:hypothetical protein
MKNKLWIIVIAAIFIVSAAIAVFQYTHKTKGQFAEIYQDGVLLQTVDLSKDTEFTLWSDNGGYNTIRVREGTIAVVEASCPDKVCVHQGAVSGGPQPIVCLPNKLVIKVISPSGDVPDIIVG